MIDCCRVLYRSHRLMALLIETTMSGGRGLEIVSKPANYIESCYDYSCHTPKNRRAGGDKPRPYLQSSGTRSPRSFPRISRSRFYPCPISGCAVIMRGSGNFTRIISLKLPCPNGRRRTMRIPGLEVNARPSATKGSRHTGSFLGRVREPFFCTKKGFPAHSHRNYDACEHVRERTTPQSRQRAVAQLEG
jgi:hypothetical protein